MKKFQKGKYIDASLPGFAYQLANGRSQLAIETWLARPATWTQHAKQYHLLRSLSNGQAQRKIIMDQNQA